MGPPASLCWELAKELLGNCNPSGALPGEWCSFVPLDQNLQQDWWFKERRVNWILALMPTQLDSLGQGKPHTAALPVSWGLCPWLIFLLYDFVRHKVNWWLPLKLKRSELTIWERLNPESPPSLGLHLPHSLVLIMHTATYLLCEIHSCCKTWKKIPCSWITLRIKRHYLYANTL